MPFRHVDPQALRMIGTVSGPCGLLNPGDLATWLSAVGTLAAFFVALGVYIGTVSDKRRAQAAKISCYLKSQGIYGPGQPMDDGILHQHDGEDWVVIREPERSDSFHPAGGDEFTYPVKVMKLVVPLYNLSDEQVTNVQIRLTGTAGESPYHLGPLGVVPPRTEREIVRKVVNYWRVPKNAQAVITFTDAAGRHWERHQDQPLKQLNSPPPRVHISGTLKEMIAEQEAHGGNGASDSS